LASERDQKQPFLLKFADRNPQVTFIFHEYDAKL
jgi:hypothetical protein